MYLPEVRPFPGSLALHARRAQAPDNDSETMFIDWSIRVLAT
jgi:hypothetical protein